MILNISGRTDIPAFYTSWFMNRIKAGYLDIRNPFYPKQVSRILLDHDHIDAIVFCTKNPIPMMSYIENLQEYPLLFQITITPYGKEIEPHLVPKGLLIEKVKELSNMIGKEHIFLRYDPILLNKKYTISYHIDKFEELLSLLRNSISRVIISFVDIKKNVEKNKNILQSESFTQEKVVELAERFGKIAKKYGILIQTCAEEYDLSIYGFHNEGCISGNMVFKWTGKTKGLQRNKNREFCSCIQTVDIGSYNSCPHLCKYCYANYEEETVLDNYKAHDPLSSILIGHLQEDDIVKVREK